ncbi:CTD small phosphatase-like protein 2 isoform X1 [Zingiber officinale]|uniref:CTD small phosphatase-like protein 2 isoform X1 n=1 Tax=Zingiber officinale TaxID=94328 RepID=UPI001C4D666C|nr:CTD small phosphatase-like protein 2 isoform X1 [Zingiber officinale]XP_042385025.1 CTD small phosphatase-like protein 2 isoform X1 [Zingiber officinale]XP_042385026.1 CTD small phosphatase-like protein 2 isoform X1 [Zingiber officinale]XP_042385027.1 CTD small phosphatase-like protein 2 isoform X1 [Zingiber officinale]
MMPTRKKALPKNSSRGHSNPQTCRVEKKINMVSEKKVSEMITSAKKTKSVGITSKQNTFAKTERTTCLDNCVSQNENQSSRSFSVKDLSHDTTANCMSEIIFSPAFHHHKDNAAGIPDKDSKIKNNESHRGFEVEGSKYGSFNSVILETHNEHMKIRNVVCENSGNLALHEASDIDNSGSHIYNVGPKFAKSLCNDEYTDLGNVSCEVSAMYLAMQNSKLECMDEQSQDSMSTDGSVEPDENDEFDDFDPYVFIRDLPDLSVVVPKFRPFLLPKQTRSCPSTTLVLDLDETLVHSTLELCEDADFTFPVNFNLKEHTIYVRCRPYLKDFLEKVASMFETIIFTASQSIYAEQLLNVIDPKRRLFRHRVYRESCVFVEGNYLKDLSVLGRDLAHVIILDNSPQAFGFQLDNGIPIESWFDNRDDRELLSLLPFLESLVGVDDVRPLIAKKFNLREKVASAAANCFSIHFKR